MKNKKLLFTAILMGLSTQAFADVKNLTNNNPDSPQQEAGYPGLSYPRPMKKEDNKAIDLNNLLSNQILEKGKAANSSDVKEMRRQALQEIAGALGASGGLSFRTKQIKEEVDCYATDLDKLYDFKKNHYR